MNIREGFAATHHANLAWSPDHEKAIDKVAASGRCDELGVLLWRCKYQFESRAYKSARTILINTHSERFKNEARRVVDAVVDQCLHEYLSDRCRACNGARELIVSDRRVVCEVCEGYGIRKYTDFERARSMKLALGKIQKMQRQFYFLHNLMGTLDRRVNVQMCEQLERL